MNLPGMTEVLMSAVLVALSIIVSRFWKVSVAKDMAIGSVRAFVQLIAVGYAIEIIFTFESIWIIIAALLIMTAVGAQAGSSRIKEIDNSFWITGIAMLIASTVTLGLMLLLGLISSEGRYLIPLGGMTIGNSMNAAALAMERLKSDMGRNRMAIETSLSLGKSWHFASKVFRKEAATAGMISILNFLKTVGIVALPGAMTGMILAGVEPIKAVYIQIIVAYMLLLSVSLTSVIAVELTVRKFFTAAHQLKPEV